MGSFSNNLNMLVLGRACGDSMGSYRFCGDILGDLSDNLTVLVLGSACGVSMGS